MTIDNLITTIAAITAIIGLPLIYLQLKLQTKQSKLEALTQIHQEVASQKFRDALGVIFAADQSEIDNPPSIEILSCIRTVTGLYDLLGACVQEGVYPLKATLKTEWKILVLLWPLLETFIKSERENRGVPYKEHFEFLAKEATKYWQKHYPDSTPKIFLREYESESKRFAPNGTPLPRLLYKGNHLWFYGGENRWEYVRRKMSTSGVTIVAITDDGYMLFVEQYRIPLEKYVIELPAGLVSDKLSKHREEIETAAKRELQEETGFSCKTISILCHGPLLPGITDETNTLCLAKGLGYIDSYKKNHEKSGIIILETNRGNKREGEKIKAYAVRLEMVMPWLKKQVKAGKSVDIRIYAGLYFLKRFPSTAKT